MSQRGHDMSRLETPPADVAPSAHPARTPLLALGVLLAGAAMVSGVSNVVSVVGRREASGSAAVAAGVRTVSVQSGTCAGGVRVLGEDRTDAAVTWESGYSASRPEPRVTSGGGRLDVRVGCSGWDGWSPSVRLVLRVPRQVDVAVQAGDAGVEVTGTVGRLALGTGDGSVRVHGAEVSTAELRSGDGSMQVHLVGRAPERLTVASGDGSVEVALPEVPEPYRLETATGDGSRVVDVRTDPAGPATVVLQTGDGSIRVRYAD